MTVVHIFAIYSGLYSGDVWIDLPLHFMGGFLAAMMGYWAMGFSAVRDRFGDINLFTTGFILVSIALLGSFIWELFEYGLAYCCESWARAGRLTSPSVADLLSDMGFGVSGGILFAALLVFSTSKKP